MGGIVGVDEMVDRITGRKRYWLFHYQWGWLALGASTNSILHQSD